MMDIKKQIMDFMQMDPEYAEGDRDWLYTKEEYPRRILDLAGSYGINIFGHNSPDILNLSKAYFESNSVSMIQLSRDPGLDQLRNSITKHITAVNPSHWTIHLTNTGTESVEAALKLAMMRHQENRLKFKHVLNSSINLINWCQKNERLNYLDSILQSVNVDSYSDLKVFFQEHLDILKKSPIVLHLTNSFHGKTKGALAVTDNEYYQQPWIDHNTSLALNEYEDIDIQTSEHFYKIPYLDHRTYKLRYKTYTTIYGCIIEPLQGEGGVHLPDQVWLQNLSKWTKKHDITLISDEIQCGLYRAGHFSLADHLNLRPDIYCFGKSIGGGIAKIGLISYRNRSVDSEFSIKHSSSFAGDKFSTYIANGVLDLLTQKRDKILAASSFLDDALNTLQKLFPAYISSIKGMGLMRGISFNVDHILDNYTFKFFRDLDLLGYWISSVLLNREKIRVFPTLSAPNTFRIQPSMHFGPVEAQHMINGFSQFFEAMKSKDYNYLLGFLSEENLPINLNSLSSRVHINLPAKNSAFFICHPVDIFHIRQIIKWTQSISDDSVGEKLNALARLQSYSVYHTDILKNSQGDVTHVTFLGIPLVSETYFQNLRSGDRPMLIEQIQKAVDFAEANDASIIGLGQFTSIVTNNGLSINSNIPLTTGNSYTVWLTHEAILEECKVKGLNKDNIVLGIVGPCGNILSILTQMMAIHVGRIILVHREAIEHSRKLQLTIKELLIYIQECISEHSLILGIQKILKEINFVKNPDPFKFLEHEDSQRYIQVSHELSLIKSCNVVVVGTNSPRPIVNAQHVQKDSIIIDVSVPRNVSDEVWTDPEYSCLSGGMAALPVVNGKTQELKSVILPFGKGQSYACMAETFGLALSGNVNTSFIGDLTIKSVKEVAKLMQDQGFHLHSSKVHSSL